ncbi:CBS domain-containing protein [Streptomyces yanii]|uniref:CBS domain-containing protein n=1 Tax=Streptomyces yanii TaxID=78510 RepID=A0ABV5R823_9ACTN
MVQQVREVMTEDPVVVSALTSVVVVAQLMRREDIGAVLVVDDDRLRGLVTDRDLVVRVLAEGGSINDRTVADACSAELVAVTPDDDVEQALVLMRERAVRRLPVVEEGRPVGVISLGDLSIEHDAGSALGDISAAEPNE